VELRGRAPSQDSFQTNVKLLNNLDSDSEYLWWRAKRDPIAY